MTPSLPLLESPLGNKAVEFEQLECLQAPTMCKALFWEMRNQEVIKYGPCL